LARKRSRIYKRGGRYWGDFRALGGKREPLVPPGEAVATTDPDVAEVLAADRIKELRTSSRNRVLLGFEGPTPLEPYASRHLVLKSKSSRVTRSHVSELETRLRRAVEFFGADRDLSTISVSDVQDFTAWLQKLSNRQGGTLNPATVRHYLNALSNLYVRALSERRVPAGHNPVRDMMDKPAGQPGEAEWLEVHEAALLLEAARRYGPSSLHRDPLPFMYPLIGTYLLTGGRTSEVLGLQVADVSFDRKTIRFRPLQHRRIKTVAGWRTVPLWPQLEGILQEHVFGGNAPLGEGLLFPSPRTGGMIHNFSKALDAIAQTAGWKEGEIRSKMFRHTYCAARLQTLDHGEAVSSYTVGRELGHGANKLVDQIYGHLGQVRHRADVVEYRIENHRDVLADQLKALGERSTT